ncbi:hypothetical protein ACWDKQ_27395 [Saccharopolyspora sp. NPDC000995]
MSTLSESGLRASWWRCAAPRSPAGGVLFYAFPVLAPTISAATGCWSLAVLTVFDVSDLAALAGGRVERWLDRRATPDDDGGFGAGPSDVDRRRLRVWYFAAWIIASFRSPECYARRSPP